MSCASLVSAPNASVRVVPGRFRLLNENEQPGIYSLSVYANWKHDRSFSPAAGSPAVDDSGQLKSIAV
jgi:hypothetical protein